MLPLSLPLLLPEPEELELALPPLLLLLLLELLAGTAALRRGGEGLSWRARFPRLAGSAARRAGSSGERDAPRRCGRLLRLGSCAEGRSLTLS